MYAVSLNKDRAGSTGKCTISNFELSPWTPSLVRMDIEPLYLHLVKQCVEMELGICMVLLVSTLQTCPS